MATLNGQINRGIYIYNEDVTINNITVSDSGFTNLNNLYNEATDNLTLWPPKYPNDTFPTGGYGFLEIRTTGTIRVNGVINFSGAGFIGGNGGGGTAIKYGGTGRGGYLANETNADQLNEKSFIQALSLNPLFTQEKYRNSVFPGSGGKGGGSGNPAAGSGGHGAGGCGGGVLRLIGDSGIIFGSSGRVVTTGLLNGGNGGNAGGVVVGNANCVPSGAPACQGTILTCSGGTSSWTGRMGAAGTNGTAGRNAGSSSGGGRTNCCSFLIATRCWSSCGCGYWRNDPVCSGHDCGSSGGCCCKNQKSETKTVACNSGSSGYGGGGGGLLLRSFGRIEFQPSQINLTGYVNRDHGGTLKVFHTNLVPDWLFDLNNRSLMSSTLRARVGGFYNEIIYAGYCTTVGDESTVQVDSLTSVATRYPAGQEAFTVSFEEGEAYIPPSLEVSHSGFEIYRIMDTQNYEIPALNEQPPDANNVNWYLVTTVPNVKQGRLGPDNISGTPANNEVRTETVPNLGVRRWIYHSGSTKAPGWYLDVTHAKNNNLYPRYSFTDNTIYQYLNLIKGKNLAQSIRILQDVLYAKNKIWYRIKPVFDISGITLSPDCDILKSSVHPAVTYPQMSVSFLAEKSTPYEISPPNPIDGRISESYRLRPDKYYDNKKTSFGNTVRGFDDLSVLMNSPTYWGSFEMQSWNIAWDFTKTQVFETNTIASVSANTPRRLPTTVNFQRTYPNPTLYGRLSYAPFYTDPLGYKIVNLTAFYNRNAYDGTISNPNFQASGKVIVLEREPTPIFHLSAVDYVGSSRNGVTFPVGDNRFSKYFIFTIDQNSYVHRRVVSGYADGVEVNFYDESIARTFPISSWSINYDMDGVVDVTTSTTKSSADKQKLRPSSAPYDVIVIPSKIYTKPGTYYPTLAVRALSTSTGFDLSAINRVLVRVPPPTAQFTHEFSSKMVSAFVPIAFSAKDLSQYNAQFPLTSWVWDVYDSFDRTQLSDTYKFYTQNNTMFHDWKWHTENYEESNYTVDPTIKNICLSVFTSAYGWRGRTDASGFSNLRFEDDLPVYGEDRLCKDVYLYERPPVAGILITDAVTLTSTFTEDDADYEEYDAYNTGYYVSGYCPYLKVEFNERSTPKSYPISGYFWNFEDYYNEETNKINVLLPLSAGSSGWEYPFPEDHGVNGDENYPVWRTAATNHYVEHTFTLPGTYVINLNVAASSTSTTRSAQVTAELVEILPTCNFVVSLDKQNWTTVEEISGYAPLTVYFTPSGMRSGSFPIGRIIWDFGDGTEPLVVDRYIDNYNNQPFGSDPRGFNGGIIEHTYERQFITSPSSFNVSLSVVSDMSNSVKVCDGRIIGPILLPSLSGLHLIKNRSIELKKENLYVFQKELDNSVYNIVLSSN